MSNCVKCGKVVSRAEELYCKKKNGQQYCIEHFSKAYKYVLGQSFKERDDFSLFIGWTAKSAEALLSGFDGIVPNPGNVIPAIFQGLYKAAVNSEKAKALKLQEKVNTLIELVQKNKTMTRTVPELKVLKIVT